jgi:hypothetical protein
MDYYFKFRQTSPSPASQWVLCGPYNSRKEAEAERRRSKAWDCELSIVFSASSKEEAERFVP